MRDQQIRRLSETGDRREILDRVVRELGEETRIDAVRAVGPYHQRVAVWRAPRRELRAHYAVRPRPIVDQHLLAPGFGQFLADRACQQIGWTACPERNDDAYGLGGELLRARGDCKRATQCEGGKMKHDESLVPSGAVHTLCPNER